MNIRRFAMAAAMAGVMLSVVVGAAKQAGGGPACNRPAQPGVGQTSAVTLKVTVTISRWDGEKKVSSSPYVLMVVPSYGKHAEVGQDGDHTSVQMGSETPVPCDDHDGWEDGPQLPGTRTSERTSTWLPVPWTTASTTSS